MVVSSAKDSLLPSILPNVMPAVFLVNVIFIKGLHKDMNKYLYREGLHKDMNKFGGIFLGRRTPPLVGKLVRKMYEFLEMKSIVSRVFD